MNFIKKIRSQLVLITIMLCFHLLMFSGILPSLMEMIHSIKDFFNDYGLLAVGVLSIVENIVGINAYFPGSVVILTAMALTAGNIPLGIATYAMILIGSTIAYNINYFLGKRNSNTQSHESKNTSTWTFYISTFWHPHLASITCYIAGSKNDSYGDFVKKMLTASLIWNTFWAIVMFNFGRFILNMEGDNAFLLYLMYIYILIWIMVDAYNYFYKKKV